MINGIKIGILELYVFVYISYGCKRYYQEFQSLPTIAYYWYAFTILTMIWELFYILRYDYTLDLANDLLTTETHVWFNTYDLSYLLPWKLSPIFYAEYGAYADKDYMTHSTYWSRIVEGSHGLSLPSYRSIINTINTLDGMLFVHPSVWDHNS